MQLEELQKHWNAFARQDALWAILTSPDKDRGRWQPEEFFATGKSEIAALMQSVVSLNWTERRRRALDFGCGVGRLTQALCDYFAECCGVDIAAEMLRLAGEFNRYGSRCSYRLNTTNDLRLFSDNYFDFIYSNIVLQHMEPEYAKSYISEFVRVLAPGGLIVFQLPSEMLPPLALAGSRPLPPAAFHAVVRPIAVPQRMVSLSETEILVAVKNLSNITWPRSSVRLGNHWLTRNGTVAVFDDARAELLHELQPGAEEQVTLRVTAPPDAAAYLLEFDMVQERVAWFKQHGSETAVVPVEVQPGRVEKSEPPPANTFRARMEMYGTPLEAVVAVVIESGGRFIEIREDSCAGENWRGYRYAVTKDPRTDRGSHDRYYFCDFDIAPRA